MRVFVTGSTGFIGQAIVQGLRERGDEVVALTRDRSKGERLWPSGVEILEGDPCYEGDWQAGLAGCDGVIHLAGERLDAERWTARFRQLIHDSRVDSTRFVAEGICKLAEEQRPSVLLSASGIDYYGFAEVDLFDDDEVDEEAPGGESFLAGLCWDWEDETKICAEAGVRVALMRTGLVLGKSGPLSKMASPFRFGLGGRIGSGTQWVSWIHIEDVVGAYLYALDSTIAGPVNLVAPGNVRNADFARALAEALGRRAWLPVPAFAVHAAVGQLAEYVLKGRRGVPGVLRDAGYDFAWPELGPALSSLLR
jgi:uncharacterized protein (TIGR01777 family)